MKTKNTKSYFCEYCGLEGTDFNGKRTIINGGIVIIDEI